MLVFSSYLSLHSKSDSLFLSLPFFVPINAQIIARKCHTQLYNISCLYRYNPVSIQRQTFSKTMPTKQATPRTPSTISTTPTWPSTRIKWRKMRRRQRRRRNKMRNNGSSKSCKTYTHTYPNLHTHTQTQRENQNPT